MGKALDLALALVVVAAIEGFALWVVWHSLREVRRSEKEAEELLKRKGGNEMDKDNNKKTNAKCVAAAVATMAFMTFAASATMGFFTACAAREYLEDQEWHEFVQSHIAKLTNKLDQASAVVESPAVQEEVVGSETPAAETDAIPFESMQWCYGGFNGAKAAPVDGCEIAGLKISSSGMTYQWKGGGCEQLGASSRSAADCIAALFVKGTDGQWRGGKFDWISTSRTSRSFKNIHGEYHGWPSDSIEKAQGYAFVITSRDGKRRTNVIVSAK